jgi:cytochrome c553
MPKITRILLTCIVLFLVVGQFFRPDRTNPPVNPDATFEAVAKPSPDVAAIVERSCYNCHSNTTEWPWYSGVAPISWLVANDVKGARAHMNFSQWNALSPEKAKQKLMNACEAVQAGDMPPWDYLMMHKAAKLSDQDIKTLCGAFEK